MAQEMPAIKRIGSLFFGPLRFVYSWFFARVMGSFFVTTTLVANVESQTFADYAFLLMVWGLIVAIITATFDPLVYREMSQNLNCDKFMNLVLIRKIFLFFFCSICVWPFFEDVFTLSLSWIVLLGLFLSLCEHFETRLRYYRSYDFYKVKLVIFLAFLPLKILFSNLPSIGWLLFSQVVEACFVLAVVSREDAAVERVVSMVDVGKESEEVSGVYKSLLSSILVMVFLRLDQLFIYICFPKPDYALYALAVRFGELSNSLSGIAARYFSPSIFSGDRSLRYVVKNTMLVNVSISVLVIIFFYFYSLAFAEEYAGAILYLPYLSICGLAMSFGQVRGFYFIKERELNPGIINGLLGVAIMLTGFVFNFLVFDVLAVLAFYLAAIVVTAVFTTPLFSAGKKFIAELIEKNG